MGKWKKMNCFSYYDKWSMLVSVSFSSFVEHVFLNAVNYTGYATQKFQYIKENLFCAECSALSALFCFEFLLHSINGV